MPSFALLKRACGSKMLPADDAGEFDAYVSIPRISKQSGERLLKTGGVLFRKMRDLDEDRPRRMQA